MHGPWSPELSITMITSVGVPVEEALENNRMNATKVVVHMVCDYKAFWIRYPG